MGLIFAASTFVLLRLKPDFRDKNFLKHTKIFLSKKKRNFLKVTNILSDEKFCMASFVNYRKAR